MTDKEIIEGLIARDEKITRDFFFSKCTPLFYSVIRDLYPDGADYNELVNELYLHIMSDNARRLRMFEGRSSIYMWLKSVAHNFFMSRIKLEKKRQDVIEKGSQESLLNKAKKIIDDTSEKSAREREEEEDMRVAAILDQIDNPNYRMILEKHVIEGMTFDDLEKLTGIKKDNLYNIKMRALKKLAKIIRVAQTRGDCLCSIRCEEYILHCFGIHKSLSELHELALGRGWITEEGARLQDLGNMAEALGLKVEKKTGASLEDIKKALEEGKRVIAAVDGGELIGNPVEERLEDILAGGIVDHCVVVLTVNPEWDEVSLFDPAFGPVPLTVKVAHFLDAWADSNCHCVIISKTE